MHSSFAGEENLHSPTLNEVMKNCSCIIWRNIFDEKEQSVRISINFIHF